MPTRTPHNPNPSQLTVSNPEQINILPNMLQRHTAVQKEHHVLLDQGQAGRGQKSTADRLPFGPRPAEAQLVAEETLQVRPPGAGGLDVGDAGLEGGVGRVAGFVGVVRGQVERRGAEAGLEGGGDGVREEGMEEGGQSPGQGREELR